MDDKIKTIMSIVFNVSVDEINDNTSSETLKTWDSLNQMNLVVALEEEFSIEFDDDDVINLDSFVNIKKLLKQKNGDI